MVHLSLIERLRRRPDLRAHRRALHALLNREFGAEIVAGFPELGLGLLRPDGTPVDLGDVLRMHGRVLVCGEPGSGRRLLLAASIRAWIAASRQELPAPLPVDLADMDDERVSPTALLTAWTWSQATVDGQAGDQRGRWMLCATGWEHLPTARQAAWRLALCGPLPPPIATIIVVAPANERMWSGYTIVMPRQPDVERLVAWAEHLAQPPQVYALREGLAHYGHSWFPALRATLAARHGSVPLTLADVYNLVDAGSPPMDQPADATDRLSLGMAAARAEQRALLERAKRIVADERYEELAGEPRPLRDTIAGIASGLMADPAPLLRALWKQRRAEPQAVLTLATCLGECRVPPVWAFLVCRELALIVRDGGWSAPEAQALLERAMARFDLALADVMLQRRVPVRLLSRVFAALPPDIARARLTGLAYDDNTPDDLAWMAADVLATIQAPAGSPPPIGRQALARWSYVHAVGGAAQRARFLDEAARPAMSSLARIAPHRRMRAVLAFLGDGTLPPVVRLAALELARELRSHELDQQIVHATQDSHPAIRAAAMAELARRHPEQMHAILAQAARSPNGTVETRADAVKRLVRVPGTRAVQVLRGMVHDDALHLHERLRAVRLLARRRHGRGALLELLDDETLPTVLCLGVLQTVGNTNRRQLPPATVRDSARRGTSALQWRSWLARRRRRPDTTRQLLARHCIALIEHRETDARVAEAACAALAMYGDGQSIGSLMRVLHTADGDVGLLLAAIGALGRLRAISAVPALAALIGHGAQAYVQRMVPDAWRRETSARCLAEHVLPPACERRLAAVMARSLTPADQPTAVSEFLISEAEQISAAVANALAEIGTPEARSALIDALTAGGNGTATAAVTAALVRIEGGCDALGFVLGDASVEAQTRWQVAQALGVAPEADSVLLNAIGVRTLDSFGRGLVAEAIGRRGVRAALPALEQLAQDRGGDEYVRGQVLSAIGAIGDPLSEPVLLAIASDDRELPELRGQAAAQLPATLSADARRSLRATLRSERPAERLAVGVLEALGRAADHEALPLLLRLILDDRPAVVRAAIRAIACIGDGTVTPALVRLSQEPGTARAVRLQAVGALLRFGDQDYTPLMRSYLHSGSVPMQLQALEELIAAAAEPSVLIPMLEDPARALPFRIRILEQLAMNGAGMAVLMRLLQNVDEPTQLRGLSARSLGAAHYPDAADVLAATLLDHSDTLAVRMACLDALAVLRPACMPSVLEQLIADDTAPLALRDEAASQLWACV